MPDCDLMMEPKPDCFTFQNSTLDAMLEDEPKSLQEQIELSKRILDNVVLPRLAALEGRQQVRLPLEFVQWDGIP
jgi:hypothetical protein